MRADIKHATSEGLFPSLNDTAPFYVRMVAILNYYDFAVIGGSDSLIGVVPKGSEIGNEVVLWLGGKVPFVISSYKEHEQKNNFKLVGGAYIHGIMDGEATNFPSWREEEFSLV